MEYLTKVRIQHAKEQLIYSPKTIGEIAVDTGFPDSSYFAVVFKSRKSLLRENTEEQDRAVAQVAAAFLLNNTAKNPHK